MSNLIHKLMHGFSPDVFDGYECVIGYGDAKGVDVSIRNIRKSFNGNEVLKGVDLEIKAGETFSIIGPSGTGKSVLLKHIVKLIQPDEGQILIGGEDVYSPAIEREHRYRYSMVFQTSALFNSLTVGENVGLWLRENRICKESRIRQIIADKLHLVGLDGKESMKTYELSGGMKKRVAIARSLAMNPDLILYDEPTAELDPVTSDELAKVIIELKKSVKITSIIVSHDLNFALYLSDRVAMIDKGRIIEVGTPSEIKASSNQTVRDFIFTTTKGIKGD